MQPHLIPHLLRKDFRHVFLPLLCWVALLLVQAVLIGSGISSSGFDMSRQMIYAAIALLIPLLQALLTIALVPLIIQDEPLVGSTAQWLTRPISRSTLLAEKLIFLLGVFILPPIVINLVVFAVNGVQASDLLASIPQFLISGLALVAPLMLLACLTPSFGRFAIWLVVSWIAMSAVAVAAQFWHFSQGDPEQIIAGATDLTLVISRGIAASLFSIVASLAIVVWQYLTRRTRPAIVLTAIAVIFTCALQTFWPINFLQTRLKPASAPAFARGDVKIVLSPTSLSSSEQMQVRSTDEPKTAINAFLTVLGLPANYQLTVQSLDAKWLFPNRPVLTARVQNNLFTRQWSALTIDQALRGPRVVNQPGPDNGLSTEIFHLKTEDFRQLHSQRGKYSATVNLTVWKYDIIGEVPLRTGARINQNSTHVTVVSVLPETGGCRVMLRETRVNLWFAGDHSAEPTYFSAIEGSPFTYLLVNRSRGEAFLIDDRPDIDFGTAMLGSLPLVNLTKPIEFRSEENQPVIDRAWLAGATLVRIARIKVGNYSQYLQAADLPLSGKDE